MWSNSRHFTLHCAKTPRRGKSCGSLWEVHEVRDRTLSCVLANGRVFEETRPRKNDLAFVKAARPTIAFTVSRFPIGRSLASLSITSFARGLPVGHRAPLRALGEREAGAADGS